jgi:V8-like Glu-specific endopeptidase
VVTLLGAMMGCEDPSVEDDIEIGQSQAEVIDGTTVTMGSPSWTNRIVQIGTPGNGRCTGILINRRWVLTAKHCKVSVGETIHSERGDSSTVEKKFNAPKNEGKYKNDTVLLKLKRKMNPGDAVNGTMPLYAGAAKDLPGKQISCYGYGVGAYQKSGDSCDKDSDCPKHHDCFGWNFKKCVRTCKESADCTSGYSCKKKVCVKDHGVLRSSYGTVYDQSEDNPHTIRTSEGPNGSIMSFGDSGGPCVWYDWDNNKHLLVGISINVSGHWTYSIQQHVPSFDGWLMKTIENE